MPERLIAVHGAQPPVPRPGEAAQLSSIGGEWPVTISTIVPAEIERFDRLARTWWNARGPMRPLHVINALRLEYILALFARRFSRSPGAGIQGIRVLDVGSGGGLLAEPLARRGARVVGIDASANNVAIARQHAAANGLAIDYRHGEPVDALGANERFDAVLALEVVEHVADVPRFVADIARHVAPGGLFLCSTINRTWQSWLFAIVGAEIVFRILPRGTHTWRRFVRPAELRTAAGAAGLHEIDSRGMRYFPVLHRASWVRNRAVNYIAAFARPRSGADSPT